MCKLFHKKPVEPFEKTAPLEAHAPTEVMSLAIYKCGAGDYGVCIGQYGTKVAQKFLKYLKETTTKINAKEYKSGLNAAQDLYPIRWVKITFQLSENKYCSDTFVIAPTTVRSSTGVDTVYWGIAYGSVSQIGYAGAVDLSSARICPPEIANIVF